MYTLMLTNSRSLRTTQFEKIYENDKNLTSFRFLIPPKFNGLDMRKFDIMLRYIAPDNQISYENVQYEKFLYEGMLSIVVPVTRKFTYKQGVLKLQLIFMSKDQESSLGNCNCGCDYDWSKINETIDSSESGEIVYEDIAFSSAYAYVDIERSNSYSDIGIIERFIQKVNDIDQRTVDNLKVYPETMEMELQSHNKPVGDRSIIPCKGLEPSGGDDNEWTEIGKYNQYEDNSAEWDEI